MKIIIKFIKFSDVDKYVLWMESKIFPFIYGVIKLIIYNTKAENNIEKKYFLYVNIYLKENFIKITTPSK